MARQLGQMGLDERLRRAFPAGGVGAAEFARGAVALHVVLLGAERQRRQPALVVDADHARLQRRRLGVQRLPARERRKGVGRVLGPVLPDVELAQLLVDAELVAPPRIAGDVGRDRLGTLQVGQADAGDAEGVFDQFAVGPRQALELVEGGVAASGDLQVEHAEERAQRLVEPALLELRPALHVERAVVEGRAGLALHQLRVGLLGTRVLAAVEQQLAAAELGLVAVHRVRVRGDQAVERCQRGFRPAAQFVRTRQLVEHAVVVRIVRVGLQVVLVAGDRGPVVGRVAGAGALVVGALHLQVAQAAQGLRALRGAGRDVEKALVGGRGLFGAGLDRAGALAPRPAAGPAWPASARCRACPGAGSRTPRAARRVQAV